MGLWARRRINLLFSQWLIHFYSVFSFFHFLLLALHFSAACNSASVWPVLAAYKGNQNRFFLLKICPSCGHVDALCLCLCLCLCLTDGAGM
jgi:hypothetical protein